jgi:hypothetical protein
MEPLRLFDPVPIDRITSLSPALKIPGIGLEAKTEARAQWERKAVYLEGLYELESTPRWALDKTASKPLWGGSASTSWSGAPKGTTTVGTVAASATVERKHFGLVAYRAAFPGRPELSFELSPRAAETA